MLSGIDESLQELHRNYVETDTEGCAAAMQLPDGLRSAVWDTVGRHAAPGAGGATLLLRNTSPWTDEQACSLIANELGREAGVLENISLQRISSIVEIEAIIEERSSACAEEEVGYLSAYWNQLVLLGAAVSKRSHLFLVEWSKRTNNMMDRAKAKSSNCFVSADELIQSTSMEFAHLYSSVDEAVLGVVIPAQPRDD
jgi:hypothetical protein